MEQTLITCDKCDMLIKNKTTVSITCGHSWGGWGNRRNSMVFDGHICENCKDDFEKHFETFKKEIGGEMESITSKICGFEYLAETVMIFLTFICVTLFLTCVDAEAWEKYVNEIEQAKTAHYIDKKYIVELSGWWCTDLYKSCNSYKLTDKGITINGCFYPTSKYDIIIHPNGKGDFNIINPAFVE